MKKLFKVLGILVGVAVLSFGGLWLAFNKKLPVGTPGPEAEALTQKMFEAVNKAAWDSTAWVKFTYAGGHAFVWDKANGRASVAWDGKKIVINTADQSGTAYQNGVMVEGEAAKTILAEGWKWFCNDTYWLIAPFKAADAGTERSIVTLENGKKGLKVLYNAGGVTPGDSYVWELDDNGMPLQFYMWVSILPIGGISGTWENWITLPTGAKIATRRMIAGRKVLDITGLSGGMGAAPMD
jgi:hypothetical protein